MADWAESSAVAYSHIVTPLPHFRHIPSPLLLICLTCLTSLLLCCILRPLSVYLLPFPSHSSPFLSSGPGGLHNPHNQPLAIASGLSVGKEGPSVHVACAIGAVVGRSFNRFSRSQGGSSWLAACACMLS